MKDMTPQTLEEIKAHLAKANTERPVGMTWDDVERMQGGQLRRDLGKTKRAPKPKAASGAAFPSRDCVNCGKPCRTGGMLAVCINCR